MQFCPRAGDFNGLGAKNCPFATPYNPRPEEPRNTRRLEGRSSAREWGAYWIILRHAMLRIAAQDEVAVERPLPSRLGVTSLRNSTTSPGERHGRPEMLPLFNSQAFLNENKWAGATLSREQRRFRRFFAPLADPIRPQAACAGP